MNHHVALPSDVEREAIQRRLAELEAMVVETRSRELALIEGRSDRLRYGETVQLTGEVRLRAAEGVNLSREGLCIELSERLVFQLAFPLQDQLHRRRAFLSWMRRKHDGTYELGLEFDEPLPEGALPTPPPEP